MADQVTCHAWNADRTLLAVCPNNNEVLIFQKPSQPEETWTKLYTLKEHDALVTEIAWAPKTNRIITTSQDRNAYVWSFEGDVWKPMLVILRISAAATSVKWCADERKFAVGSGAKVLAVCNHDEANNFWVSKQMKQFTSTVISVAWDPTSSVIIATACTDYKCRIFSAYMKGVDGKNVETRWGKDPKFGTLFLEVASLGWVRDVAFDATGTTLAFASQNSTIGFVDGASHPFFELPSRSPNPAPSSTPYPSIPHSPPATHAAAPPGGFSPLAPVCKHTGLSVRAPMPQSPRAATPPSRSCASQKCRSPKSSSFRMAPWWVWATTTTRFSLGALALGGPGWAS